MSQEITLSVVIPSHNNLHLLKRCVDSWRLVKYITVELVVIEDGCNDGTAEWLESVADNHWLRWFHEDDVFETLADNRGFQEARGRYILIWQDDMFLKAAWFIEGALNILECHKDLGVLGLMRGHIFRPLRYTPKWYAEIYDPVHAHLQVRGKAWQVQEVHSCVRPWIIRRECIEAHGIFDPAYAPFNWDEHDLHMRLRTHGWKNGVLPGIRMGGYTHLANSSTSKHKKAWFDGIVLRNGIFFHERWDKKLTDMPPCNSTWPVSDRQLVIKGGMRQLLVDPFLKHGLLHHATLSAIRKTLMPAYKVLKPHLRQRQNQP